MISKIILVHKISGKALSIPFRNLSLKQFLAILRNKNYTVFCKYANGRTIYYPQIIYTLYLWAMENYGDYAKYCQVYHVFAEYTKRIGERDSLSDRDIKYIRKYKMALYNQYHSQFSKDIK